MKKNYLAITTTTGLCFVKKDDLLYCCSDGAYTNLFLSDGRKLTISKNLKEIETALAGTDFIRIHHSHLVNIAHIKAYVNNSQNYVKMSNGEELAVSRNRKKGLLECFTKI
ncbi:MAG: LytTR family DNA-binding domain-containing protein [Bacteroidota bacterium]